GQARIKRNNSSLAPFTFPLLLQGAFEDEFVVLPVDRYDVFFTEGAIEHETRDGVLDVLLDRALERPRAEDRVEARAGQLRDGGIGDFQTHLALGQALTQSLQLD